MIRLIRRLRRRDRSRGQSLVEFALVLPILLLIVLITVDFGRALYGWVVLQNSARIAANYAGTHPEGWQGSGEPTVVDEYEALILNDLDTANCTAAAIPDPAFSDGPDTAVPGGNADTAYDVGDTVMVRLTCDFTPATPIISAVVGNLVTLGASSEFRIRAGDLVGLANPTKMPPPPPPPTPTPVPTPTPTPVGSASPTPTPAPTPCTASVLITRTPNGALQSGNSATFTGTVTIAGCTVASYAWTFPQGTPATATSAGPHTVVFTTTTSGNVLVELTIVTSTGLSVTDSESVRVNR